MIRLSARQEAASVSLFVADNGPGIPDSEKKPYSRDFTVLTLQETISSILDLDFALQKKLHFFIMEPSVFPTLPAEAPPFS